MLTLFHASMWRFERPMAGHDGSGRAQARRESARLSCVPRLRVGLRFKLWRRFSTKPSSSRCSPASKKSDVGRPSVDIDRRAKGVGFHLVRASAAARTRLPGTDSLLTLAGTVAQNRIEPRRARGRTADGNHCHEKAQKTQNRISSVSFRANRTHTKQFFCASCASLWPIPISVPLCDLRGEENELSLRVNRSGSGGRARISAHKKTPSPSRGGWMVTARVGIRRIETTHGV